MRNAAVSWSRGLARPQGPPSSTSLSARRPIAALTGASALWARNIRPKNSAHPRPRAHAASSTARTSRIRWRPGRSSSSHPHARSVAGSPAHRSPKSMTPVMRPRAARTFRPWRSPCSHRSGPSWSGRAQGLDPAPARSGIAVRRAHWPAPGPRSRCAGRAALPGTGCAVRRRAQGRAGRLRNPARASAARTPATPGEGGGPEGPSRDVGAHRPAPRVEVRGLARADRGGHRQGQAGSQLGHPPQLRADQACPELTPGHPDREVRAEPEHRVVPPGADPPQASIGEIRVLVAQQAPHEVGIDLHLGRWDRCAHRAQPRVGREVDGVRGRARPPTRRRRDRTATRTAPRPPSHVAGAVHYGGPIRRTDRHRRYR